MSTETSTTYYNFIKRNLASFTNSIGLTSYSSPHPDSFTDSIGLTKEIETNSDLKTGLDEPAQPTISSLVLEDFMYGFVNSNKTILNKYSKIGMSDPDASGIANKLDIELENMEKGEIVNKELDQSESKPEPEPEPKSKPNDQTKNLELLKLAWSLIPSKVLFVLIILVTELVSSLGTLGLLMQSKFIVICTPIAICILGFVSEMYTIDTMYRIKRFWQKITLEYFYDLPWAKRQSQEDMTDFHRMINSSSSTLFNLISWGIPTIVTGLRSLVMVCYILIVKGYWKTIIVTAIIYWVYFTFVMRKIQDKITSTRTKMKDLDKILVPKRKWLLQLFKNKKRNPEDIIRTDEEFDILEKDFIMGWEIVTNGVKFVSSIISFIGLFGITEWDNLLLVKIIFDELRYTIEMFSRFSNNFTSRAKDFDKFLTWYEDSGEREKKIEYLPIPKDGIKYKSVNINIDDKFILDSDRIDIQPNDTIILRGPTGVGKTQLINALQGFLQGAKLVPNEQLQFYKPEYFQVNWEYMDQNMRETIPSNGMTLRDVLGGEPNTELIWELVKTVKLDDKIQSEYDIDTKIKNFSGGQRMKVSLIFTLLEVIKKSKSILVLDEPEQGLDPYSRRNVVSSILDFCKSGIKKYIKTNLSVLVIYHGDDTDLVKMKKLANKFWLLSKNRGITSIEEITRIGEYCKGLIGKKRQELDELEAELEDKLKT